MVRVVRVVRVLGWWGSLRTVRVLGVAGLGTPPEGPTCIQEDNRRIYGKCNNPHFHGHNYTVVVVVRGPVDQVTGVPLWLAPMPLAAPVPL